MNQLFRISIWINLNWFWIEIQVRVRIGSVRIDDISVSDIDDIDDIDKPTDANAGRQQPGGIEQLLGEFSVGADGGAGQSHGAVSAAGATSRRRRDRPQRTRSLTDQSRAPRGQYERRRGDVIDGGHHGHRQRGRLFRIEYPAESTAQFAYGPQSAPVHQRQ